MQAGDSVVVVGAGPLGLMAALSAMRGRLDLEHAAEGCSTVDRRLDGWTKVVPHP